MYPLSGSIKKTISTEAFPDHAKGTRKMLTGNGGRQAASKRGLLSVTGIWCRLVKSMVVTRQEDMVMRVMNQVVPYIVSICFQPGQFFSTPVFPFLLFSSSLLVFLCFPETWISHRMERTHHADCSPSFLPPGSTGWRGCPWQAVLTETLK